MSYDKWKDLKAAFWLLTKVSFHRSLLFSGAFIWKISSCCRLFKYTFVLASAAAFVEAEGQRHTDTHTVSNCNFQIPLNELASYVHLFSLVTRSARPLSWIGITNRGNDIGFARLLQPCSPAQITEGHFVDRLSPRGATLLWVLHRSGSPLPCCCCHGSQSSQVAHMIFRCASRGASKRSVFPFLANTQRRDLSQSLPMSRCTRPLFSSFLRPSFSPLVYRNT